MDTCHLAVMICCCVREDVVLSSGSRAIASPEAQQHTVQDSAPACCLWQPSQLGRVLPCAATTHKSSSNTLARAPHWPALNDHGHTLYQRPPSHCAASLCTPRAVLSCE